MRTKDNELLKQIKEYVATYCDENGCGPSVREIAKDLNISSSTAQSYMAYLKEKGELVLGPKKNYEDKDYEADRDTTRIEIVGSISCGPLAEAQQENRGYVRVPRYLVGQGSFFFLEANGDSMVNAGIDNGDLILVKRQNIADYGQIVVALVENETTLKRLQYNPKKRKFYLHPENEKYDDIYVDQLEIQGVAVRVIKEPN